LVAQIVELISFKEMAFLVEKSCLDHCEFLQTGHRSKSVHCTFPPSKR